MPARRYHPSMLHFIEHGHDTGRPPLLIAHGLFGSGRNWGVIARRLADRGRVVAVDMRNHGRSPWHATHSYPELAADLAEVIAHLGGPADVVGHSMGGKAAMVLALSRPELVRRLIVADIAPVAYGHSQSQHIAAMRALDLDAIARRSEAREQLAARVADPQLAAFFVQSLDIAKHRWMLNLDTLEAEMPRILGFPRIDGRFAGPTLFLSGAASDYVRPEHRPRIRELFPNARFARIPGAGHWLHAERPRAFEAAVRAWLDAPPRSDAPDRAAGS
ncbi:MAG: alpha/beta fold hydrolase [Roseovarius sp.]